MDNQIKGHFRHATIAAISTIPVAGGPLGFLLDKYIPDYLTKKREDFVNDICGSLEKLKAKGIEVELTSEDFLSTLVKCLQIADGVSKPLKISALKSIVLRSAIPCGQDFDEQSLFIRLVETLTTDQIRILNAIHMDSDVFSTDEADLFHVLSDRYPNIDRDYLSVCTQELVTWNLVASKGRFSGTRQNIIGNARLEGRTHYLTDLGFKFMNYIISP